MTWALLAACSCGGGVARSMSGRRRRRQRRTYNDGLEGRHGARFGGDAVVSWSLFEAAINRKRTVWAPWARVADQSGCGQARYSPFSLSADHQRRRLKGPKRKQQCDNSSLRMSDMSGTPSTSSTMRASSICPHVEQALRLPCVLVAAGAGVASQKRSGRSRISQGWLGNQHARSRIRLFEFWPLRCDILDLPDTSSSELAMRDMNEEVLR
jgi:hypothetical protein